MPSTALGAGGVTPGIQLPAALPSFPAGVDPFAALAALSPDQRAAMLGEFRSQLDGLPEQMRSQGAIIYVIREYQAIGFDLKQLQFAYMFRIGSLMAAPHARHGGAPRRGRRR